MVEGGKSFQVLAHSRWGRAPFHRRCYDLLRPGLRVVTTHVTTCTLPMWLMVNDVTGVTAKTTPGEGGPVRNAECGVRNFE